MTNEITNGEDIIDSRDIIARIEELDTLIDDDTADEDEREEFKQLKALAAQCEGYGDWEHGEALISADYFVDYVKDLLEDCGDIPRDVPWYVAIDWEATAENIKVDYMAVDFDGQEYFMRSC